LPSSVKEDLSKRVLEAVDLDSNRTEVKQTMSIILEGQGEYIVSPVPPIGGGGISEPEMDLLSSLLESFHEIWGNIDWKDIDQVKRHIADIPAAVSRDAAYQNALKNSDKQNARIESERARKRAVINMMAGNMVLFKQYNDNPSFNKWLSDMVFNLTYNTKGEKFDGEIKV
jgi:type I restriction enzyme R subunit